MNVTVWYNYLKMLSFITTIAGYVTSEYFINFPWGTANGNAMYLIILSMIKHVDYFNINVETWNNFGM